MSVIPLNIIPTGQGSDVSGLASSGVAIDPATQIMTGAKILATGSYQPRTLEMRFADCVNALDGVAGTAMINDGGTTGNSIGDHFFGTDNTAAFQALLAYTGDGKGLFISPGGYYFADPVATRSYFVQLAYNKTLIWGIPGATVFYIDDIGTSSPTSCDFFEQINFGSSTDQSLYEFFYCNGITFQSRWSQFDLSEWDGLHGKNIFTIANFTEAQVDNCRIYDLRGGANRSQYINSAGIRNSTFLRIGRGSVGRWNDTNHIHFSNNIAKYLGDDVSNPVSTGTVTIPSEYVSFGNTYEQCQGEVPVGLKLVVVNGNTYKFCTDGPLAIGSGLNGSAVADTAMCLSIITNNIIENGIGAYIDGALRTFTTASNQSNISAAATTMSSATTGGTYPGWANGTTVVDPLGKDSAGSFIAYNFNGTNESIPAGFGTVIANNSVGITLPPTGHFSDYGFGQFFAVTGWQDPPVALNNFVPHGISLYADQRNVVIANNSISGFRGGAGIRLNTTRSADTNKAFGAVVITNNVAQDVWTGIDTDLRSSGSTVRWGIKVANNLFDCDPFFQQSTRTGGVGGSNNGSWQSGIAAASQPVGIAIAGVTGWDVQGNTFKNCYNPILPFSDIDSEAVVLNNIMQCDPAAVGFSTSNKGIGTVHSGGPRFHYIVQYCDPTSAANYGKLKNVCAVQSAARPTSGTWVAGTFVANRTPSLANDNLILGWLRLTTGTANVDGTDWKTCYGFVGQYSSSTVNSGSAVSLTTDTTANVTSLSLGPGTWDVNGNIVLLTTGTTATTTFIAAINTTSATLPVAPGAGGYSRLSWAGSPVTGTVTPGALPLGPVRMTLSAATTVYLVTRVTFAASTCAAYGFLGAKFVG